MISKELIGLIYTGDLDGVQQCLDSHDSTPIVLEWEPYTMIQRTKQADALLVLMNDPRFVFDEWFVSRMVYFSTRLTQTTVWRHPRMAEVCQRTPSFTSYFHDMNPQATWSQTTGIGQRFVHADRVVHSLRRNDRQRLLFVLYPALRTFARRWRSRLLKAKSAL